MPGMPWEVEGGVEVAALAALGQDGAYLPLVARLVALDERTHQMQVSSVASSPVMEPS